MSIKITRAQLAAALCGRVVALPEGYDISAADTPGAPEWAPHGWTKLTVGQHNWLVVHRWVHREMLADIAWVNWALNAPEADFEADKTAREDQHSAAFTAA